MKDVHVRLTVTPNTKKCILADLLQVLCSLNMTYGQEQNIIRMVRNLVGERHRQLSGTKELPP